MFFPEENKNRTYKKLNKMNVYIEDMKWAQSVHERLLLGIKIYGTESKFMSDYSCYCIRMKKNEIENLFEKYGLYTRSQKLKQILNKI